MTENDVEDIGYQLKSQRERLGYSLQDIAQNTRIRKTFLESLENNQFSDLPGQAYVTGFIKAYARYLGIDSAALLARLEEVHPQDAIPPSLKPISSTLHQTKRSGKTTSSPGWGVLVIVSLLVVVAGAALYFLVISPEGKLGEITAISTVTKGERSERTDDVVPAVADKKTDTVENSITSSQEKVSATAVVARQDESKTLPLIPAGGASLRMLALSEGSLIIYVDDQKSRPYALHNGLDLAWQVKETVKVELAEPGLARFWLGEEVLEVDEMKSFQLHTTSGD